MREVTLCRLMKFKRKCTIYELRCCSLWSKEKFMEISQTIRIGMEVCGIMYGKSPISAVFIKTLKMEKTLRYSGRTTHCNAFFWLILQPHCRKHQNSITTHTLTNYFACISTKFGIDYCYSFFLGQQCIDSTKV